MYLQHLQVWRPGGGFGSTQREQVNREEPQATVQLGLRARPLVLSRSTVPHQQPNMLGPGSTGSGPRPLLRPRSADSSGLRGRTGVGPRGPRRVGGGRSRGFRAGWRWGDLGDVPGLGGPRCGSFGVHVTAGVFGQVVAAHEAALTHTTHKLLFTGVSPAVAGELIRTGKLLLTAVPVTAEGFLTYEEDERTKSQPSDSHSQSGRSGTTATLKTSQSEMEAHT